MKKRLENTVRLLSAGKPETRNSQTRNPIGKRATQNPQTRYHTKCLTRNKIVLVTLLLFFCTTPLLHAEELRIDTGTLTAPNFRLPGKIIVEGILDFEDNWAKKLLGNNFYQELEVKFYLGDRAFGQVELTPTAVEKEVKWSVTLTPTDLPLDAPQKLAAKKFSLKVLYQNSEILEIK